MMSDSLRPYTELPPFYWKSLVIAQSPDVLKVGTDAILLGTWVPKILPSAEMILDAGCGCGILTLLMASAYPGAFVHAVDDAEAAVLLTEHNAKLAGWADRITVHRDDLLAPLPDGR